MVWCERTTFRVADFSIATNESYKEIAIRRGGMKPERVMVVRSGPKLERLRIIPGDEQYKKGRRYLVGYLGTISEQEGIDLLLESVQIITKKRQDVQFAIIGGSTTLDEIKQLAIRMGVSDYVDFYGRIPDAQMLPILNTADVGVNPDKPTEMNNLSTMNKIMEYMALKKPIVQFDLKEGRFSANRASLYAEPNNVQDFAEKIMYLLDNPAICEEMGEFGHKRVVNELSWTYERIKLLSLYDTVLASKGAPEMNTSSMAQEVAAHEKVL